MTVETTRLTRRDADRLGRILVRVAGDHARYPNESGWATDLLTKLRTPLGVDSVSRVNRSLRTEDLYVIVIV